LLSQPLLDLDPALALAMDVLSTPGRYQAILNGTAAELAQAPMDAK
jgi:hypothetical protein